MSFVLLFWIQSYRLQAIGSGIGFQRFQLVKVHIHGLEAYATLVVFALPIAFESNLGLGMEKSIFSRVKYKWLFASFFIGIACWLTFSVLTMGTSSISHIQIDEDFDSSVPRAALSPSDVVSLQVRSIRASVGDVAKLKVCYSLASHENRKQTGPFSRFSRMVKVPPYDRLATCVDWQLGGTVVDKEFATVLVSTVSKEGDICGFRFILQRQNCNNEPCWMTEGVDHLVELSVDRNRREAMEMGLGN